MSSVSSTNPVRVALVNDFQHIVEGMRAALEQSTSELEIVELDVGEDPHDAVDVALLDTFGHAGWAIGRVRQLQRDPQVTATVVHASSLSPQQCEQLVAAGARAVVAKHHPVAVLVDVLLAVSRGDVVVHALFRRPTQPTWPGWDMGLTERQSEVAGLLAGGASMAAISSALNMRAETVRSHARAVADKLGADSVADASKQLSQHAQFRRSTTASRWRAVGV